MKTYIDRIENYAPDRGQVSSYLLLKKVERMAIEKGIDKNDTVVLFGHLPEKQLIKIINEPTQIERYVGKKTKVALLVPRKYRTPKNK